MLLSDNYGPDGNAELIAASKARAKALATNPKLNAIARSKVAFRPVELSSDTTAVYTARINAQHMSRSSTLRVSPPAYRWTLSAAAYPRQVAPST